MNGLKDALHNPPVEKRHLTKSEYPTNWLGILYDSLHQMTAIIKIAVPKRKRIFINLLIFIYTIPLYIES